MPAIQSHTRLEEREGVTGKGCNVCKEWRPLEDYQKHPRGLGKRRSTCRKCRVIPDAQLQKRRASKISTRNEVEGKECLTCQEWKPLEDFYRQGHGIGGRMSYCIECESKKRM